MVESEAALIPALAALRASMSDPAIAIDLEWRPDRWTGSSSRVSLVQLASSNCAVLVRPSRMGWKLPPALRAFLWCGSGFRVSVLRFRVQGNDARLGLTTFS